MKKNITTLLLLITLQSFAFTIDAQPPGVRSYGGGGRGGASTPKEGYGKFSGIIVDQKGEAIPYATIKLMSSADQKLINGTIAGDDGKWVMKNVPEGDFKIVISFIGYEANEMGPYKITGKGESFNLNKITLKPSSIELDQVVVEGQRDLIEDKVDRIVYNAEQDLTTRGGDATDVLRRVPLLTVDLEGNVALRGSNNITVLIDGKPSTITAGNLGEALQQIPADEIKSVEVITSPSARFDAEGTGGIINIVTKKNNLQGGTLSLNTGVGFRGSNLGINAGYRTGKLGLSLGGRGFAGYNILGANTNQQIAKELDGTILSETNQFGESTSSRIQGGYVFGWDYTFNKYNFIGGDVNYRIFDSRSDQDDRLTEITRNGSSTSLVEDVFTLSNSNSVDVSFNYIRSFEKKGREISLISLYSQDTRNNDFTIDNVSGSSAADRRNENNSINQEFTIQLDIVEPISDKVRFETGLKNISRTVTSDFRLLLRQDDGSFVSAQGDSFNNALTYNQNVTAGFVSGLAELPSKYTLQTGVRYEYTSIQANFSGEEDLDIADYGTVVPSLNMSKKLENNITLKLGYSRRIARPSLRFLNPNINAANPLNVSQGNPDLLPENTDQFEFSVSRFKRSTSLNASFFVRSTNQSIQSVRETIGVDTVFTTFQNIGEADAYGMNVFASYRKGKLNLSGGVDVFYNVLNNNIEDPIFNAENSGFVFNTRVFGGYKLSDRWALQMFGFYSGSRVQLQGRSNPFYIYSLSINRKFKKDNGSIGVGLTNFANPRSFLDFEVDTPLVSQRGTRELQLLNFKVNFSYRIGKLTRKASKKIKRVSNDDLKGGDDSNNERGVNQ